MKKPTAKQLAARAKFAEMARSGALAKKRKANPTKKKADSRYVIYRGNLGKVFAVDLTRVKAVQIAKHQSDTTGDRFWVEHGVTGRIVYDSKERATRRVKNPAKPTVGKKISQLRREGYPQKQAVAVAMSEKRAGKVRANPIDSFPQMVGYYPRKTSPDYVIIAKFATRADAVQYATAKANQKPDLRWFVKG